MKSSNATAATYAKILSEAIPEDSLIAAILDSLLCVDEIEELSDFEWFVGSRLFDKLCDLRPDAVTLAGRWTQHEAADTRRIIDELNQQKGDHFHAVN